jgi:hypothetical protein
VGLLLPTSFVYIRPLVRIDRHADLDEIGLQSYLVGELDGCRLQRGCGVGHVHEVGVVALVLSPMTRGHLKSSCPNLPVFLVPIYPLSMSVTLATYKVLLSLARAASPLIGRGSSKLARGLAGRRSAHEKLARWGKEQRDAARPTVWFHAPSVGEGLQALAVIEALRERDPTLQVAFTHFSPSALPLASQMAVDVAGYVPWDLPGPIGQVLDAMSPELIEPGLRIRPHRFLHRSWQTLGRPWLRVRPGHRTRMCSSQCSRWCANRCRIFG